VAYEYSHISDLDLILAADGELPRRRIVKIEAHLQGCWSCRARRKAIDDSVAEFVRTYHDMLDCQMPPPRIPRALLKARLNQLATEHRQFAPIGRRAVFVLCVVVLAAALVLVWPSPPSSHAVSPDPVLTPGVTAPVNAAELCEKQPAARTRAVMMNIGKKVFEQYGIRDPKPRSYEMDYLIDLELGGAHDARNLWPQPYSVLWNANVKDALENHLRELVCSGQIALAQAQRDISADWISAYKGYFHTDRPLPEHEVFRKDRPWE
jgi:hypothetical protein